MQEILTKNMSVLAKKIRKMFKESFNLLVDQLRLVLEPSLLMKESIGIPDPWQEKFLIEKPYRSLLLCCRQSGKSTVVAILALHQALFLPPAEILIIAPSLRQSHELLRKVKKAWRGVNEKLTHKLIYESASRLEFSNESRIVALPAKEETIRSFGGLSLLIIDEAARVSDDLYYTLRPMLATSKGRLIALSTPWGKRGWFYEAWIMEANGKGEVWEKTKITAEDCPRLPDEFLLEEKNVLGEWWFRQEYLCEFVETEDQMFGLDLLNDAIDEEVKVISFTR